MKTAVMGILIATLSLLGAKEYSIDKTQSKVGFEGSKFLAVSVEGVFENYEGEVSIEDGLITALKGKIAVDSVQSGNETRDEHIRGESLIDSQKFPYITFVMKEYKKLTDSTGEVGFTPAKHARLLLVTHLTIQRSLCHHTKVNRLDDLEAIAQIPRFYHRLDIEKVISTMIDAKKHCGLLRGDGLSCAL